jgi:GxxExxY protein
MKAPSRKKIVDAALAEHKELGPGLPESVYEAALGHELKERGLVFSRQHRIAVRYKGNAIMDAIRTDILVEDKVTVELKSVEQVLPVHKKQLIASLKLTGCKPGLLVNFGPT